MILAEIPVTTEFLALVIEYTSGIGNISYSFIYKRNYYTRGSKRRKLIATWLLLLIIKKRKLRNWRRTSEVCVDSCAKRRKS